MDSLIDIIICRYLSVDEINDETEISSTLDSLLLVEMITEIEEECGIEFELEDLTPENLHSVKNLRALVASKIL